MLFDVVVLVDREGNDGSIVWIHWRLRNGRVFGSDVSTSLPPVSALVACEHRTAAKNSTTEIIALALRTSIDFGRNVFGDDYGVSDIRQEASSTYRVQTLKEMSTSLRN